MINETFSEYKRLLQENNNNLDPEIIQASFYNSICELRFLGLVQEKKKITNEFNKIFFSKSFYTPLSDKNI